MVDAGIDADCLRLHRQAHRDFLCNASSIHADVAAGNPKRDRSLLSFFTYWLAYHVLGMDQDMAKQIRAIQAGMTAAAAFEEREHIRASETEPLLAALDGLFHEVTDQNKQLKQLNATLEQQMALRTRQLSEANRALEALSQSDSLTGSWMWLSDAGQPSTSSIVAVQCGVAAVEAFQLMLGDEGLRRAHARTAAGRAAGRAAARCWPDPGRWLWDFPDPPAGPWSAPA